MGRIGSGGFWITTTPPHLVSRLRVMLTISCHFTEGVGMGVGEGLGGGDGGWGVGVGRGAEGHANHPFPTVAASLH